MSITEQRRNDIKPMICVPLRTICKFSLQRCMPQTHMHVTRQHQPAHSYQQKIRLRICWKTWQKGAAATSEWHTLFCVTKQGSDVMKLRKKLWAEQKKTGHTSPTDKMHQTTYFLVAVSVSVCVDARAERCPQGVSVCFQMNSIWIPAKSEKTKPYFSCNDKPLDWVWVWRDLNEKHLTLTTMGL